MWGEVIHAVIHIAHEYLNKKETCIKPKCSKLRCHSSKYCEKHDAEEQTKGCLMTIATIAIIGVLIYYYG